jgi:hypothetical protein
VDDHEVERTLDQLIAWGLVEDHDGDIQPTRRWVAKLQAAAERLNLVVQRTGVPPEGNPLVLAVTQALSAEDLTRDEDLFRRSVQLLVVLELSRMSPEKRGQHGFDGVAF